MADRMMNCGKFCYSLRDKIRLFLGLDPMMSYLEAMRKYAFLDGGGDIFTVVSLF